MKTKNSKIRILVFADLHTPCIEKIRNTNFSEYNYDVCFTLGDINCQHLNAITECVNCSVYGVIGNHDEYGMLEQFGIMRLDSKEVIINGFSVTGLSGSSRYKIDDKPMLTQKESIALSKQLPPAEILVSHDSAYGLYGAKSDKTHCGLKGISKYIKKYKPIVNLHGHHHENCVKNRRYTTDICVFGCSVIEILGKGLMYVKRVF